MENANVVASCQKHIANAALAANCSGFVKAVAGDFGLSLHGQANEICDYLRSSAASTKFGSGLQGAITAAREAETGVYLIIGASYKQGGNGHVVIVTGQDDAGNVLVYGGSLGQAGNASLNERIQKRAWAKFKLTDPFVAREAPSFFGLRISIPYKG